MSNRTTARHRNEPPSQDDAQGPDKPATQADAPTDDAGTKKTGAAKTKQAAMPLSRCEARRMALIEAATESFLAYGYNATTLDMVIAKTGGSRRTLYEYFKSKEKLFEAVISQHVEKICKALSSFEDEGASPADVFRTYGRDLLRHLTTPATVKLFRLIIGEASRFPGIGVIAYRQGPRRGYERLTTYLRQADQNGKLTVPNPEKSARHLQDLMRSDFFLRALLDPTALLGEDEINAHVDQVVGEFLRNHQA